MPKFPKLHWNTLLKFSSFKFIQITKKNKQTKNPQKTLTFSKKPNHG